MSTGPWRHVSAARTCPRRSRTALRGDIFFDILQYQVEASRERDRAITLDEAFLGFESRHPAPIARRMVKRGMEAVAAPLSLPPRPLAPDEDQATAELDLLI